MGRVYMEQANDANEVIRICLCALVIVLNIIEIIMILQIKRKKTVYEIMLTSLSVSDIILAATNTAFGIMVIQRNKEPLEYINAYYFVSVITNIFHLIIIVCDRLAAVYFPLKHKLYSRTLHVKIVLSVIWLFKVIVTLLLFMLVAFEGPINQMVWRIITPLLFLVAFLYIVCYSLIAKKLLKSSEGRNNSPEIYKVKSAVLLCFLTTICFIALNIPLAFSILNNKLIFISTLLPVANGGLNSILFFFRGKFREWFQSLSKKNLQIVVKQSMRENDNLLR